MVRRGAGRPEGQLRPGKRGGRRGDQVQPHSRRGGGGQLGGRPWDTLVPPPPPPPSSAGHRRSAAMHTFLPFVTVCLQAAGARGSSPCRPTTTPSTTTTRSMCPSCKRTAASCRVRVACAPGPCRRLSSVNRQGDRKYQATRANLIPCRMDAHVPPHAGAGRG